MCCREWKTMHSVLNIILSSVLLHYFNSLGCRGPLVLTPNHEICLCWNSLHFARYAFIVNIFKRKISSEKTSYEYMIYIRIAHVVLIQIFHYPSAHSELSRNGQLPSICVLFLQKWDQTYWKHPRRTGIELSFTCILVIDFITFKDFFWEAFRMMHTWSQWRIHWIFPRLFCLTFSV